MAARQAIHVYMNWTQPEGTKAEPEQCVCVFKSGACGSPSHRCVESQILGAQLPVHEAKSTPGGDESLHPNM